MYGYGNEQTPHSPSGYGGAGYGRNGYGSDEETRAETGYGNVGYGRNGYGGTGYSTADYGGNMQSAVGGSSFAFAPSPEDSNYTPPDVWSSGYQENVYDQAALLDTPYVDTARDPNRGGNPAYQYSISDQSSAHGNPITPSGFEPSEPAVSMQPLSPSQSTAVQNAKKFEQLRRSQPKAYRSKVFDVELDL